MKKKRIGILASITVVLSVSACASNFGNREDKVRSGCVEEKMREDGYTREFALNICEGQAYMYGTEERPQYETDLEQAQQDLDDAIAEWDSYSSCMETWDYNPPSYVDC